RRRASGGAGRRRRLERRCGVLDINKTRALQNGPPLLFWLPLAARELLFLRAKVGFELLQNVLDVFLRSLRGRE
ncbi:MAG: hypothetical protein AAGF51_16040, partial [Pseudomonadota bacterium]